MIATPRTIPQPPRWKSRLVWQASGQSSRAADEPYVVLYSVPFSAISLASPFALPLVTSRVIDLLRNELHNSTSLLDFSLGVLAKVTCADNERNLRDTTLAENLGVSERKEVENWRGVRGALAGEVLFALLERNEGPELG